MTAHYLPGKNYKQVTIYACKQYDQCEEYNQMWKIIYEIMLNEKLLITGWDSRATFNLEGYVPWDGNWGKFLKRTFSVGNPAAWLSKPSCMFLYWLPVKANFLKLCGLCAPRSVGRRLGPWENVRSCARPASGRRSSRRFPEPPVSAQRARSQDQRARAESAQQGSRACRGRLLLEAQLSPREGVIFVYTVGTLIPFSPELNRCVSWAKAAPLFAIWDALAAKAGARSSEAGFWEWVGLGAGGECLL